MPNTIKAAERERRADERSKVVTTTFGRTPEQQRQIAARVRLYARQVELMGTIKWYPRDTRRTA